MYVCDRVTNLECVLIEFSQRKKSHGDDDVEKKAAENHLPAKAKVAGENKLISAETSATGEVRVYLSARFDIIMCKIFT
jgi:hypothetical protein